jgi:ribosomal protein S18 acetylase RimI-like enzyme
MQDGRVKQLPAIERPVAQIVRVEGRAAIVAASGDDVCVRSSTPLDDHLAGWVLGPGVAWLTRSRRRAGAGWLTVVAGPESVPALVQAALDEKGAGLAGLTIPADALPLLAVELRPPDYNLWEWFSTETPPPLQRGEEAVAWGGPEDEPDIVALLDADSPRHSSRPGDFDVLRWCVVRENGQLVACAALTEHVPGVPHLASIVTRSDQRGRGLGRAVTAWITRQILRDGAPRVTLGMYSDNDVARRVYLSLGYQRAYEFASGYLPGRRVPAGADPVHDEPDSPR